MIKSIFMKILKIESHSLTLISFLFFCCFLLFFSSSCRLYKLERQLDPENAEFLSKVRYIITGEERKVFLELPDSEKEEFKEEFWKRRDPDLATEENEFKMEYFNRIEQANELFTNEGRDGWMTDRGRIHILFGPPQYREVHSIRTSASYYLYGNCGEIWHYGNFPVVFVDTTCAGNYRLITYNLSSIRSLNLMYMHEFSKAQAEAQKTYDQEKRIFDFNWRIKKEVVTPQRIEGIIFIEIPYDVIWYKAEDDRLVTTLDVELELKDFEGSFIWEYKDAFEVSITEDELKERKRKNYKIEIPFTLEEGLDKLRQGKNLLRAVLKNRTGGEEIKKVMEFII